jgi:signal transduction histidine kinase
MAALLDKLPTILVLAVLVGIFLFLRKHTSSPRVRLWTYAWALIFLHFFVQAFETRSGAIEQALESIDLAALEVSGIVFVISLTRAGIDRLRGAALFAVLAVPAAFHAFAVNFNLHPEWASSAPLVIMALGGAGYAILETRRPRAQDFLAALLLLAAGYWAVKTQLRGHPDFAVEAILTLGFGLSSVLYWKLYRDHSPSVTVVSGGFLFWGAVFPVGAALDYYLPHLQLNAEIWNVPKFFVAFGMVLTLIEEKSRIIEAARNREHAENRLLSRLSQVRSRLLSGKDPAGLGDEIAIAVAETSTFTRAALLLTGEGASLHLAGSSGLAPFETLELEQRTSEWKSDTVKELCARGRRAGNHSCSIPGAEDEILVPLVSWRGSHVGCLWLSGTRPATAEHNDILKLEMLASDLAVTIENSRLHHRLVRSEKLAALGQLVAGVAHELNNPLAGIMGYADLLGEEVQQEGTRTRVQKLSNEARRMKRIVDGLLRFARQNNAAPRSSDLEAVLRDVTQLREYHLRKLGIRVEIDSPRRLPAVAIGEDELKQVLLNILGNAVDAVQGSARREIRISAALHNDTVVVCFDDSGPGFADLNRAFDPFYTTKALGRGTGLGLSICYGIMQECGGEISLINKEPYGASVCLEFPAVHSSAATCLGA